MKKVQRYVHCACLTCLVHDRVMLTTLIQPNASTVKNQIDVSVSSLLFRAALALDILVIKENVGFRGLPGPPVLPAPQLRWSDSGMALLCSRWLDLPDLRDRQERTVPQDLQELMGSL